MVSYILLYFKVILGLLVLLGCHQLLLYRLLTVNEPPTDVALLIHMLRAQEQK